MIDRDGNEYPDPPADFAERQKWKTIYFAQNYGMGSKRFKEMMNTFDAQIRLDLYRKRVRVYAWILRVELFCTLVSLVCMIKWTTPFTSVMFVCTVFAGLVCLMRPPKHP